MKKEKRIIIIITILISLITYIFFLLTGYNSLDRHRIELLGLDGYATEDASFKDGRLFMGIICLLANQIKISYTTFYQISLIVAIVISAFAVWKIYDIVNHYKKAEQKREKIILFLISYLYIFNFMYIDGMQFIENFVIATSILLYIIGIEQIVIRNNKIKGFVSIIIGVFFYQGTIPLLVSTACLVSLLENKKIDKNIFKKLIPCAIACILAVILNIIFIKIVNINSVGRVEQIGNFSIFWHNIKGMWRVILNSLELFPAYLWITFIIILLIVNLVHSIKNKEIQVFFYTIIVLFIYIVSQFVLFLAEPQIIDGLGRTYGSIGALFSAIAIFMYCNTNIMSKNNKNLETKVFILTVGIFFIINLGNTLYITKAYKQANELDKELSYQIKERIDQEEIRGNKVEKMAIIYLEDESHNEIPSYLNDYIKQIKLKCNYMIGTYNHIVYKIYTGEEIKSDLEDTSRNKRRIFFKSIRANTNKSSGRYYICRNKNKIERQEIKSCLYVF